jgi:hypothetical protein
MGQATSGYGGNFDVLHFGGAGLARGYLYWVNWRIACKKGRLRPAAGLNKVRIFKERSAGPQVVPPGSDHCQCAPGYLAHV